MSLRLAELLKFVVQGTDGNFYSVAIDKKTGAGYARDLGTTVSSDPEHDKSDIDLDVDAGDLSAWKGKHPTYSLTKINIFETDQSINDVVTA